MKGNTKGIKEYSIYYTHTNIHSNDSFARGGVWLPYTVGSKNKGHPYLPRVNTQVL